MFYGRVVHSIANLGCGAAGILNYGELAEAVGGQVFYGVI